MKKQSRSRDKDLSEKQFHKRQERRWECVRRNKGFIHDFELFKGGKLDFEQTAELMDKWDNFISETFGDPNISYKHDLENWHSALFSLFAYPRGSVTYFAGDRRIHVFRPGEVKSNKYWGIVDKDNKVETLTEENCPRWISIMIEVQPRFSKSAIKKCLLERFDEAYELIKGAQTAVLKKKTYGPRDDDEFQKFITVFDYKDKNPGITLNDIAVKMFPEATYENKRHTRTLAESWAKEKVRYYLERADYYINKQGWKEL